MKRLILFTLLFMVQLSYSQKVKNTFTPKDYKKFSKIINYYSEVDPEEYSVTKEYRNYEFNVKERKIELNGFWDYGSLFQPSLEDHKNPFTFYKNRYNPKLRFSPNNTSNAAYHEFMEKLLIDYFKHKLFDTDKLNKTIFLTETTGELNRLKFQYINEEDFYMQIIEHALNSDYEITLNRLGIDKIPEQYKSSVNTSAYFHALNGNMGNKVNYIEHFPYNEEQFIKIKESAKKYVEQTNDGVAKLQFLENFTDDNNAIEETKLSNSKLTNEFKLFYQDENVNIYLKHENSRIHIKSIFIDKYSIIKKGYYYKIKDYSFGDVKFINLEKQDSYNNLGKKSDFFWEENNCNSKLYLTGLASYNKYCNERIFSAGLYNNELWNEVTYLTSKQFGLSFYYKIRIPDQENDFTRKVIIPNIIISSEDLALVANNYNNFVREEEKKKLVLKEEQKRKKEEAVSKKKRIEENLINSNYTCDCEISKQYSNSYDYDALYVSIMELEVLSKISISRGDRMNWFIVDSNHKHNIIEMMGRTITTDVFEYSGEKSRKEVLEEHIQKYFTGDKCSVNFFFRDYPGE